MSVASTRCFTRGSGAFLFDECERPLFDAISSVWTTTHGHCEPRIVERIAVQAATLDHATLLGATNPLAEALAEKLAALSGLQYAFFASDGASAIEAALKMTLQYWQNVGKPDRTRFVKLSNAYHGDTAAAMSVSDIALFKERFGPLTFEVRSYDDFRESFAAGADDLAGIIVEPTVQAAAGMRIVDAAAYAGLASREALLIVDEIATGFGRTGTMFAFEQLDLRPDIVCVGKGLTGGALALSATLTSAAVYDAFCGEYGEFRHFFHGHSYAGNPIACAAALASLEIFEDEGFARVDELAASMREALSTLAALPAVREIRQVGVMAGIELEPTLLRSGAAYSPGWAVANELFAGGFFTRPIGNVVQLVPPYCSMPRDIRGFVDATASALHAWRI